VGRSPLGARPFQQKTESGGKTVSCHHEAFGLNGLVKFLPALALFALPLHGTEVEATLNLVSASSSVNRFTVRISATDPGTGLTATDTKTSNATGNFITRMEVNPATGKVSELSFEGGKVALSDMNFNLRVLVFISVATLNTSGLEGFAITPEPPAPVDEPTGNFDASYHNFTITKGTITGNIVGSEGPVSVTIDENPLSGPGTGTGTVVLTPVSQNSVSYTYLATIELPVDFEEVLEEEGVSVKVTGRLRALNQVVIPKDPFTVWASTAGVGSVGFSDEIRPGEPAGLVWAMGLQPDESLADHTPRIVASGPPDDLQISANLELPATGSAGPLLVEVSDSLAHDSWLPAPAATVGGGLNPLPPGSGGRVTVTLEGSRKFVRLSATAP